MNPIILVNHLSVDNEINNYKLFRKYLIKFVNRNPIIKYKDFRKEATSLYYNIKCKFNIYTHTLQISIIIVENLPIYLINIQYLLINILLIIKYI